MNKFKFFFLSILFATVSMTAVSQNIQMHYDLGHKNNDLGDRAKWTTTVEFFHPDKWGSTFFFVDFDYQHDGVKSAYSEISRELKFWNNPFSLHVEYNGGLCNAVSYDNAFLLGSTYAWNAEDYHAGFTLTPSYKYLANRDHHHSAQFTTTWYYHFINGMFTFSGFADIWGEPDNAKEQKCVFISEPQLWFNLNKVKGISKDFRMSLGTEQEISYNFLNGHTKTLYWLPTLAVKWTFK